MSCNHPDFERLQTPRNQIGGYVADYGDQVLCFPSEHRPAGDETNRWWACTACRVELLEIAPSIHPVTGNRIPRSEPRNSTVAHERRLHQKHIPEWHIADFIVRTTGGRPNQMDLSAYLFHDLDCGCGSVHTFDPRNMEVMRELPGMRLVIACPQRHVINLVHVRGVISTRFETLAFAADGVPQVAAETVRVPVGYGFELHPRRRLNIGASLERDFKFIRPLLAALGAAGFLALVVSWMARCSA